MAAINAVTAVFPGLTIKGCSFHFRQALRRRLQYLGLRFVHHSETDYPSVRNWLREIMAMSVLPSFAVPLVWQNMKQHPVTGSPIVHSQCASFADYFNTTWINDELSLALWTYFDHRGPRTTNVAEGWHKGLNSQFGMPHPSLQSFLNWLQKCQLGVQCRLIQLASGRPTINNVRFATCDWTSKHKTLRYITVPRLATFLRTSTRNRKLGICFMKPPAQTFSVFVRHTSWLLLYLNAVR